MKHVSETNQNNNIVGRDQAGRDINYYVYDKSKPTYMRRLIERFKVESESNQAFRDVIPKLQHYKTPVSDEPIAGLEPKLQAGHRDDLLQHALATKEMYAKKIVDYQFSEAAQEIHACLLAEVYTRFTNLVHPAIRDNRSSAEINRLIQTEIIDYVESLLDENVLGLQADEIAGILYFLTGNCHTKWT